jgi:hypothetical protein
VRVDLDGLGAGQGAGEVMRASSVTLYKYTVRPPAR